MVKYCPVCDEPINDGEDVAAVVKSTMKELPSKMAYAITTPTECVEVIHWRCTDYPKENSDAN